MKKVALLACILIVLSGCSSKDTELERGMALRSKLLSAESVTFSAEIQADYGDRLHSFSLDCAADALGNLSFTVETPETISGITGRVSREGGELTFDDAALQFDLMADDQLSPVSAPWILMKTLRGGFLTSACTEDNQIRLTIDDSYEDDALQLDIWLDGDDLPARAEILYDGRKILSLHISNFQIG